MKVLTFGLFICLAGFLYNNYWKEGYLGSEFGTSSSSDYGFVTLPRPSNVNTNKVIILAAKNCTKEAALRANRLASELSDRNIPYTRLTRIAFQDYDPSMKRTLDSVLRGPVPVVLVHGKGKANPTLSDVLSEYDSAY